MPSRPVRRTGSLAVAMALVAVTLSACGGTAPAPTDSMPEGVSAAGTATAVVFDASEVHQVAISFDETAYAEMIDAYAATGDKEWIEATVTIDGVTYERAGIRLKGNSSLRGLGGDGPAGGPAGDASPEVPEELPWLIRLDEYVDGQNHQGVTDLVIRSNNSETSLNEAVALDLLEVAGLATEQAMAVSFTVNGSEPALRLAIEHPDDAWMAAYFDDTGALYKAESTGDYSYRGDDPDSYDEVFDQEAGEDNADLTPLIEFLDFINNSDDATFEAELADRLDVDAFATYLAIQDLIDNFDDIDGPGNNSYLYYDTALGEFTVVAWDHNLAFGALGAGGPAGLADDGFAQGGLPGGGAPPAGFAGDRPQPPGGDAGAAFPDAAGPRGGPGGRALSNILVERFKEVPEFAALYEEQLTALRATLYDSGAASEILDRWVTVLSTTDLVDDATLAAEAAAIAAYFEN